MVRRIVRNSGEIKWKGKRFMSVTLVGETVGLEEMAEGQRQLYVGSKQLAVRNQENTMCLPLCQNTCKYN